MPVTPSIVRFVSSFLLIRELMVAGVTPRYLAASLHGIRRFGKVSILLCNYGNDNLFLVLVYVEIVRPAGLIGIDIIGDSLAGFNVRNGRKRESVLANLQRAEQLRPALLVNEAVLFKCFHIIVY